MSRIGRIFVASAFGLLALGATATAAGAEEVTRERVDITVRRDGTIRVVETIDYDFGPTPRHGIIRYVPVRTHYDDKYDRRFPIDAVEVDGSEGTPVQFEESSEGAYKVIKIGDPDRTITGVHRYVISYDVQGALTRQREHDELYWNAIGDKWPVVRNNVVVDVHGPARITRATCFTGAVGSRLGCDRVRVEGRDARFVEASAFPGEELTIVVALPRGTITPPPVPILDERWSVDRAFSRTPATLGLAGGLLALLLAGAAWTMWRVGRDRRYAGSAVDVAFGSATGTEARVRPFENSDSPVEFVPPDNLRPGLVGTLIDEQANPLDVTATIVDLAVRGYLTIEEIPKEGWFGKPDWKLTKNKENEGLAEYERSLFTSLFGRGRDEVTLSKLKRTFADDLARVQKKLYQDVVARGWFSRRPDHVRALWTGVGIAVTVVGIGLTVLAAAFTHWGLVPIPLILAGLVLVAGASKMPHRTAKGTGTLRRVLGFRTFIEESEKERARFAEQQNLFSEYLPYAIVFGCVDKWAKAFEGLAALPDTGSWYRSSQPFTTIAFVHAIDGFTVTTAGTISAAAPSSSGGSGFSGGSSGGGGGGGGGGSW